MGIVVSVITFRIGTARSPREGLRIGTVRIPPRGVAKADYARRDYFDVWLPTVAPSRELMRFIKSRPITPDRWRRYATRYRAQMRQGDAVRVIRLLAEMSRRTSFSIGCYCEDESRCHRSLLFELLAGEGAETRSG